MLGSELPWSIQGGAGSKSHLFIEDLDEKVSETFVNNIGEEYFYPL